MSCGCSSALNAIALNRISPGLISTSIELWQRARPRRAVVTWSDVVGLARKMLARSYSSGLAQAVLPRAQSMICPDITNRSRPLSFAE
jgi:hypothetical protein